MKKKDVFKLIMRGAQLVPGPVGLTATGIDHLIHRDNDPTNDVDETADAVLDVVTSVVADVEGIAHKDFVNNAALVQLGENIKGDIKLYQQLVRQLKP